MLFYKDKGKGKSIVLLHGFLENLKMWEYFQEKLSKNYRVITIDLPGHGKSSDLSEEVYTMEYIAEKVNEVLEFLKIDNFTIIGHSMGGYVALALVDLYKSKIDGLGLFYSTTLPDDEEKKEQRLKVAEIAINSPNNFFALAIPNLFADSNSIKSKIYIEIATSWAHETTLKGISASLKGMRLRKDRTYIIKEIHKPVSILTGMYDKAIKNIDLKNNLEGLNHISFYELPTGHMGSLEAPNESLEIIETWLKTKF